MSRARGRGDAGILTLAALAVADIAFAFQQTAIVPAIPAVQRDLHASQAWSAWLLTGYLVASSVATPLLGKLGCRSHATSSRTNGCSGASDCSPARSG